MNIQYNEAFMRTANTIKIEVLESGFADLGRDWRMEDVCSPYSRLYYVISGEGFLRIHGDGAGKSKYGDRDAENSARNNEGAEKARQNDAGTENSLQHGARTGNSQQHGDGVENSAQYGDGLRKRKHCAERAEKPEVYIMRPGHLYMIPNGLSYDYFCEDRLEKVYIHINVLLQNGLELFNGCKDVYELPVDSALLDRMKKWMTGNRPEDYFHLQGEVYHAAAAFMEKAGIEDKINRQYSEIVHKLFSLLPGLNISVSVQEIAMQLNVSESTLAKGFKKETGMSIGSYRELLIMSRARQLLAMGKLSIGEIADELGFGDRLYFSKYFKQRQSMTPSEYKKYYR